MMIYFGDSRRRLRAALMILLIAVPGALSAGAQQAPTQGMVWTPPEDAQQANADLLQMERMGVQAVRTGLIEDPRLLRLADRLGIQFYQELPIEFLPAEALRDTATWAADTLRQALAMARGHRSARHFGLARFSDTSAPAACAYFEELSSLVPAAVATYYVTAFVEEDQCVDTVDLVLLDARDKESPGGVIGRWEEAHPEVGTEVGLASVGTWTRAASDRGGLDDPRSAVSQARYLEGALNDLLEVRPDTATAQPDVLFLYRWRSRQDALAALDRPGRSYGLVGPQNELRPAYEVAEGFYSGGQTLFAFPTGRSIGAAVPWLTIYGWLVVALLAAGYAGSPRFRRMVPRYFGSHGFYREAVQEGRDIMNIVSVTLLAAVSLSVGIAGTVFASALRDGLAFQVMLNESVEMREMLGALIEKPWLSVLVFGAVNAAIAFYWSSILALLSRRQRNLSPGQCLALVVWPRWTYHVLMVALLVLITFSPAVSFAGTMIVAALWLAATVYAIIRTIYDYARITRVSPGMVAVATLLNPVLLLVIVSIFVALEYWGEAGFLWHLATRS